MGCSLGAARKDGSAPQDALVILDYGQPQLRDGVYGSWDFGDHYQTVTKIRKVFLRDEMSRDLVFQRARLEGIPDDMEYEYILPTSPP